MTKYCGNCGSKIGRNGKCPKCDQSKNNKMKVVAIIIGAVMFVILALGVLVYCDVLDIPFVNKMFISAGMKEEPTKEENETEPGEEIEIEEEEEIEEEIILNDSYEITPPDADAYFQSNATVQSEMNAAESTQVHGESDVYHSFEERGFKEYPITTEYTMEGEYVEEYQVSRYSGTKHPIYQTYHMTAKGDVWMILEINGAIFANPLSYNGELETEAPIIVSETNTMTSYDSTTNKFYVHIPNADVLNIKTVPRIDAETLETITLGTAGE